MSKTIYTPQLASIDEHTSTSATFIIEPLHTGYGMTLGNSMRRVLLGSIAGADRSFFSSNRSFSFSSHIIFISDVVLGERF